MIAPLTIEDLKLGHAPIDPETVEYTDDREAVYGPAPWQMTRIRVIRDFALFLMAIRGGYGITIEEITAVDRKGRDRRNEVMNLLFKRHAVSPATPAITRSLLRFQRDAIRLDTTDRNNKLRSHLEDDPLFFGTVPYKLFNFVMDIR